MPSPSTSKWPRPHNDDEFEDMVLDAMRLRWGDPDAHRYGRRGQRQHGIDIRGRAAAQVGARRVAQAKNTDAPTIEMLQQDLAKTKGFPETIERFYFVVSAPRDGRLLRRASKASLARSSGPNAWKRGPAHRARRPTRLALLIRRGTWRTDAVPISSGVTKAASLARDILSGEGLSAWASSLLAVCVSYGACAQAGYGRRGNNGRPSARPSGFPSRSAHGCVRRASAHCLSHAGHGRGARTRDRRQRQRAK